MFDYIIIGAGSAGCVLAQRLSENPAHRVLLIEAGGKDKKMEIHIPAAYGKLNYSNVDWGFYTEPQSGLNNRKMYQPRGKTLGGSSSTNAMAYIRGHRNDYDLWEKLGAQGWGYKDVLPFFKKSECNEQIDDNFHGTKGLLNVTFAKQYRTPLAEAFVSGCIENNIPENRDCNGAEQSGAGFFQFTIKGGKRHSTAQAFLVPALHRRNLKVMTNTLVQRILIENDKVVGVEVKTNTGFQTIKADKEIILCGGAFASPQILMLSGVGAKDELKKHGIELKKELAGVGNNLHDHLFFGVSCLSNWKGTLNNVLKPINQTKHLLNYFINKKGPLTISPLEAYAFFKSDETKTQPDIQFHFAPAHLGNEKNLAAGADIYNPATYPKTDGFTILPSLIQPKSRGYVKLRSNNPSDAPIIQPNYLAEEADCDILIKGFHAAKAVIESKAVSAFTRGINYPTKYVSDDDILAHIRKTVESIYHPVGTCKMGDDVLSVVDSQLRVHGVENLRVADASVMPQIISGNTNAACIMIGERCAEFILR